MSEVISCMKKFKISDEYFIHIKLGKNKKRNNKRFGVIENIEILLNGGYDI